MIFLLFDLLSSDIYFTGFNKLPRALILAVFSIFYFSNLLSKALILKKVGQNPLAVLIPLYGEYKYFSIFWKGYYGIAQFVLSYLLYKLLPADVRLINAGTAGIICAVLFIAVESVNIIAAVKLARSFGKDLSFAFCIVFVETVFAFILALSDCEYLGPTLRDFNSSKLIDRKKDKQAKQNHPNRQYMITLYRRASITALIACNVTIIFSIAALESNVILFAREGTIHELLRFFTINSNILTTLATVGIITYTITGIRGKRLSYPRWLNLFYYASVVCTTLTMVFAVTIISLYDFEMAFGAHNFFLHIVCPIAILVSFFQVESDYRFTREDSLIALAPFTIYSVVYATQVFLIGEENGGWPDIYRVVTYFPVSVSYPLMMMVALGASMAIGRIYNYLGEKRRAKIKEHWPDDVSPVEIKIEIYGLGRYMGMHEEATEIKIPLDIFNMMTEKYDVRLEELTRAFAKGVGDGSKERNVYLIERKNRFYSIYGTPYKLSAFYKEDNPYNV